MAKKAKKKAPKVKTPKVKAPKVKAPKVKAPKVKGSGKRSRSKKNKDPQSLLEINGTMKHKDFPEFLRKNFEAQKLRINE
jgi:hypothetical protein